MNEITSVSNPRVKQWVKYHDKKHRDRDGLFLVEGEHLIQEAITAGLLTALIISPDCPYQFGFDGECYLVSEEIMKKLRSTVSINTCVGVCKVKDSNVTLGDKVILLDDVQDPGNAGTIIRTAYSFGFDAVVFSGRSVDIYNEKLIRSTQGALFHMSVLKAHLPDMIHKLKQMGTIVYGTSLHEAKGLSTFVNQQKTALVFGNEGNGISEAILNLCDDRIFIEMNRFESLNVAVAAGICCYAFRKQDL